MSVTALEKNRPSKFTVALAQESDFDEIQSIYALYVLNTTVSLEEEPPTVEEMKSRWHKITENNLPYLVAKIDGRIAGYAYVIKV